MTEREELLHDIEEMIIYKGKFFSSYTNSVLKRVVDYLKKEAIE